MTTLFRALILILFAGGVGTLGWKVWERVRDDSGETKRERRDPPPAPVTVAPITRGSITLRRSLSGSLEATEAFVVAARIGGRVDKLTKNLGDRVTSGELVAQLDDEEYGKRVAQASAELAVARANKGEADSALIIADRALARMKSLQDQGIESESDLDVVVAQQLTKKAKAEVAEANVTRAAAVLAAEEIRLGYAKVIAKWSGDEGVRVVGERFVDVGETATPNQPLMTIVQLDPVTGVVFVAERDYAQLAPGQAVEIRADAYPGVPFAGSVERIAPVFRQSTRQARVELKIPNPAGRLKPGMFVKVSIELRTAKDAIIVPAAAITRRDDATGVFLVDRSAGKVTWRKVTVGIREGDRVQILGEGLEGSVVTLGQQLIDDGSAIVIPVDSKDAGQQVTSSG